METKFINQIQDTGFTLFQRNNEKADLRELAEEFEAMFINQMTKEQKLN